MTGSRVRYMFYTKLKRMLNSLLTPEEKGDQFEEFVLLLFNQRKFKLERWNNSRKKNNVYPLYLTNPDLELIFKGQYNNYKFAVECKWRQSFKLGSIDWVKNEETIKKYATFQSRNKIPVFIAIGIGGLPSDPAKMFVTPLDQIKNSTKVFESELIPFERKARHRFFYNTKQLKLF